jgi:hypothetical protein
MAHSACTQALTVVDLLKPIWCAVIALFRHQYYRKTLDKPFAFWTK